MLPMMALAVLFCGVATGVAQDNPPIRSKQITLPQVEEQPMWQTRNTFGQIRATYLESTPTRVKLKMPRGDVQEIPMFYFGAPPIHYFLNRMAKIRETDLAAFKKAVGVTRPQAPQRFVQERAHRASAGGACNLGGSLKNPGRLAGLAEGATEPPVQTGFVGTSPWWS